MPPVTWSSGFKDIGTIEWWDLLGPKDSGQKHVGCILQLLGLKKVTIIVCGSELAQNWTNIDISLWSSEAPEGWVVGRWGCKSENYLTHPDLVQSELNHCLEVGWGTWLYCFALHWTAAMQCTVSNLHWNVLYTALSGDCAVYITQDYNVLHYPHCAHFTHCTLYSSHTHRISGECNDLECCLGPSTRVSTHPPKLFFCPIHARGLLNVRLSRIA